MSEERASTRSGFLVASPQMVDVFFSRTVVLLCDYNEEGAIGIVVNRVSGVQAHQVLDQLGIPDSGPIQRSVLWGGPVQPGAVFLTFGGERPGTAPLDPLFRLQAGLHVSPARAVIQAVARERERGPAFLSLGYAGWASGQLDGEIRTGSWIPMEIDPEILFETPIDVRWDHCRRTLGVLQEQVWMQPVDE